MKKTTRLLLAVVSFCSSIPIGSAFAASCYEVATIYNRSGGYHCALLHPERAEPLFGCSGGGSTWVLYGTGLDCVARPYHDGFVPAFPNGEDPDSPYLYPRPGDLSIDLIDGRVNFIPISPIFPLTPIQSLRPRAF